MKKLSSIIVVIISTIFITACNEKDILLNPGKIENLSTTSIAMSEGIQSEIEFSITPTNSKFNYDVSQPNCQIKLQKENGSTSDNYYLYKVEPIKGIKGRYKAIIFDSNKSKNYKENSNLIITNDDLTEIKSENIQIYYSGTSLFSISFLKENNEGKILKDISVVIDNNDIKISTPFISNPYLKATLETNAEKIIVNGVEQENSVTINDFSTPICYTAISAQGLEENYTIDVSYSGLPVVIIETPNKTTIPSKHEDWLENTNITILNADGSINYTGITNIRGRGNSTWTYPKKPYALKLEEKAEILGMPKHKRWVLLANWQDRTLLRNHIGFHIANLTDLSWNPHGEFVDVILNDVHIGNYYLCEQIKIDKNRVNINELDLEETEGENITGGYLMELDVYFDEINKFHSPIAQLPYMFKDPDEVNTQQFTYMQNFISELEESLYNDEEFIAGKYMDYMDIDSYIDWWFVMELVNILEPNAPKSSYMHKDKLGKLKAGPVWDFDYGTFRPGSYFHIKDALYYNRLFQDKRFITRVKERWSKLKSKFELVPDFIESEAVRISNSEKMNHIMWPITNIVNKDEDMTFQEAVQSMKNVYETKLKWLNKQINQM